jgi:hypothetical protein
LLARPSGLEPETYCLEGSCSIQLSYERITETVGASDGNRTHVASLEGWNSTIELHPQEKTQNFISFMLQSFVSATYVIIAYCLLFVNTFFQIFSIFFGTIFGPSSKVEKGPKFLTFYAF